MADFTPANKHIESRYGTAEKATSRKDFGVHIEKAM